MTKLDRVQRFFNRRLLMIWAFLFIVITIVLSVILFTFLVASGGLLPLDIRLTYTFDEVLQLFVVLGVDGRGIYTMVQVTDMVFPFVYSMLLFTVIGMLVPKVADGDNWLNYTVFVPFFAALFDYIENISIATQIASYPNVSQMVILIASTATVFKWIFNVMSILFVLIYFISAKLKRE